MEDSVEVLNYEEKLAAVDRANLTLSAAHREPTAAVVSVQDAPADSMMTHSTAVVTIPSTALTSSPKSTNSVLTPLERRRIELLCQLNVAKGQCASACEIERSIFSLQSQVCQFRIYK